ncbi:hypothetical protein SAMN05421809_2900 [Natronorubrum daqingense]|uniref:Uncharacterized protein n=1 Tax=Natronorubrum daqingense TaxID=588898 RepID=A0A1N7EVX2_9EURY|nr:hypothetical protein SAMN05421809_2900 [Natronorubrum daqingense]
MRTERAATDNRPTRRRLLTELSMGDDRSGDDHKH